MLRIQGVCVSIVSNGSLISIINLFAYTIEDEYIIIIVIVINHCCSHSAHVDNNQK